MPNHNDTTHLDAPIAPLWRRLAALGYDMILLAALWVLVAAIAYSVMGHSIQHDLGLALFRMTLFMITFVYFAYFWMHGGQTTGMQAWRIQIRQLDSTARAITPWQALLRFLTGLGSGLLFGLGFFWMLIDRRRLTWHDRYAETQVFIKPGPSKSRRST